ncbi:MAG: hypothetical protein OXG58_07700 [Gemmatimonadetes bacterium]|nr:hypothetical protein [Gemmatimonadota bacterium]MCY3944411.1 hypothetical protein [Gemmatimonadota bacterium]
MRTTLPLSVATATLMALSCSAGGPEVCAGSESIPQQTVKVGEDLGVTAICFEDPSGGTLTYTASSADVSIVETFIRGSVWIRGVAPGQATVTATATNEADKSESIEFQVLVTNQAPEYTGPTEGSVGVGRFLSWNLNDSVFVDTAWTDYFVEPDGEEMTFEVTSNSGSLAVRMMDDSIASFTGMSEGQVQATLTATDPHGGSGSGNVDFTVWEPQTIFEDGFDNESSLDNYEIDTLLTMAAIENGWLELAAESLGFLGYAFRDLGGEAIDWTIDVSLRTVDADATSGIRIFTGHQRYVYYELQFGLQDIGLGDANFVFAWFDRQANGGQGGLFVTDDTWGISSFVEDFVELDVSLTIGGNRAYVTVDGNTLFYLGFGLPGELAAFMMATWLEGQQTGLSSRFNEVRVTARDFADASPPAVMRDSYERFDFGEFIEVKQIQQHK